MKLWLDDVRSPPDTSWVWVKTAHDAIRLLGGGGVTEASLDHDLGVIVDGREETGYDVLLWIERQVVQEGFVAPRLTVHSANPPAGRRMEQAIAAIERQTRSTDH